MPKLEDFLNNTNASLEIIRDLIIRDAKKNLKMGGKYGSYNASNALTDSIRGMSITDKRGVVSTGVEMLQYGEFLDKGVQGVKQGTSKANPKYKFKSKGGKRGLKGMPPPSAFDKWSIRRKIAPRDEKGRFLPRKSVNFGIAVSIFHKGIKPTLFLTKAFEKHTKKMAQEVAFAFGEDTKEYVEILLKDLKK